MSETSCPITGEECPKLASLERNYRSGHDSAPADVIMEDLDKLSRQRAVHLGQAAGCGGVVEVGECGIDTAPSVDSKFSLSVALRAMLGRRTPEVETAKRPRSIAM